MNSHPILTPLLGTWRGTCRTWFEPGKLADESPQAGTISAHLGGGFIRHTYTGSMQGKERQGEETFVFNPGKGLYEVAWMDTFHMSEGIQLSEGSEENGKIVVMGYYDVAPGEPRWGWKTEYHLAAADHLVITAYNVTPDGEEARAVEIDYRKVADQTS